MWKQLRQRKTSKETREKEKDDKNKSVANRGTNESSGCVEYLQKIAFTSNFQKRKVSLEAPFGFGSFSIMYARTGSKDLEPHYKLASLSEELPWFPPGTPGRKYVKPSWITEATQIPSLL